MAYSSTNPPAAISQTFAGGPKHFVYQSTHTAAAAAASGFISNGYELGMRVGDLFTNIELTTAGAYTAHANGAVSASVASSAATVTFAQATT